MAKSVPPVGESIQWITPAEAVALNDNAPLPQFEAGVVLVIVGTELIVAVTAVRLAVVQPLLVAST